MWFVSRQHSAEEDRNIRVGKLLKKKYGKHKIFGNDVTDQSCVCEEITNRLNTGIWLVTAHFRTFLPFRQLPENMKSKL